MIRGLINANVRSSIERRIPPEKRPAGKREGSFMRAV
jgi:hypothetical protein